MNIPISVLHVYGGGGGMRGGGSSSFTRSLYALILEAKLSVVLFFYEARPLVHAAGLLCLNSAGLTATGAGHIGLLSWLGLDFLVSLMGLKTQAELDL